MFAAAPAGSAPSAGTGSPPAGSPGTAPPTWFGPLRDAPAVAGPAFTELTRAFAMSGTLTDRPAPVEFFARSRGARRRPRRVRVKLNRPSSREAPMTAGRGYWMPAGSGRWVTSGDYARLRVADVDREQTADVLRGAYVEGRLTQDELDARLGQAYAARTYADLAALAADLPAAHRPWPGPVQLAPGSQAARGSRRARRSRTAWRSPRSSAA